MKSFSERNQIVVGAVGLGVTAAIVLGAVNYTKLPFVNQGREYTAYFAEAGGLKDDSAVQVSGFKVG
ncbi:mammalian cell entry protein, partial [Mycobacterium sp. ITM-2017-0098]